MNYTSKNHTFVICAYKENPHIELCIKSLLGQTIKSKIIIVTSTPCDFINNICKKYGMILIENPVGNTIGADWNFGYLQATTELITIAHQDDYYEPDYLENILKLANKREDTIIIFTDYYELKMGKRVNSNKLLFIKKLMNSPLSIPAFWGSEFIRRRTLSMGCAICCPSVTFVRCNAGESIFNIKYSNSLDFRAWVDLSKKKGAFIYTSKKLMGHRIYPESTTTLNIASKIRQKEDFEILCEFWPKSIAKLINKLYSKSENSNNL
jgi:glycosyltransferase involved in cell wall biosynthesis